MQPHGGGLCPGETSTYTSDPGFRYGSLMTFDPATRRWAEYDSQTRGFHDTWSAVYDAQTDTLVAPGVPGGGYKMGVYNITAKTWATYFFDTGSGPSPSLGKTVWAADLSGRRIFIYDSLYGQLYRWDMDQRKFTGNGVWPTGGSGAQPVLVPVSPCGPAPAADRGYLVWDSKAKVLIQSCYGGGKVYAFHPDDPAPWWEDLLALPVQGPGGATPVFLQPSDYGYTGMRGPQWAAATFDQVNNWVVGIGWQGVWLFRYAAGSTPPPTPTPIPDPVPTPTPTPTPMNPRVDIQVTKPTSVDVYVNGIKVP